MQPGAGELLVIPSIWGHFAGKQSDPIFSRLGAELQLIVVGFGNNPADVKFLDEALRDFFLVHQKF